MSRRRVKPLGSSTGLISHRRSLIFGIGQFRHLRVALVGIMHIKNILLVAIFAAFAVNTLSHETRPATNAPSRRAQSPPVMSPEILPDGGVTFRYRARKATEVKVSCQFVADAAMTKNTQGVWSVTVPAVAAGVYEYRFVVDGLSVID